MAIRFEPAKQNGKPVRVRYNLPSLFKWNIYGLRPVWYWPCPVHKNQLRRKKPEPVIYTESTSVCHCHNSAVSIYKALLIEERLEYKEAFWQLREECFTQFGTLLFYPSECNDPDYLRMLADSLRFSRNRYKFTINKSWLVCKFIHNLRVWMNVKNVGVEIDNHRYQLGYTECIDCSETE